jgi:hypothetical protein
MPDEIPKPRVSALALAKRSDDFASVAWTPENVRQLRPAWSIPEARHFLEQHQVQLAHMMLEIGWRTLAVLIEQHEQEARYD